MKTGLVILFLFLGWSLKAPPLPPPPGRTSGAPAGMPMYFTNANHGVVTVPSRIPVPDFSRPTFKSLMGMTYSPSYTNTVAKLAAQRTKQEVLYLDCLHMYETAAVFTLYLVWTWLRGSIFAIGRRYFGFFKRKEDASSYWAITVIYFAFNLFLYYLAIAHVLN